MTPRRARRRTHQSSNGVSATPPVLPAGSGVDVGDATTASRAIQMYRTTPPTGSKGLQDISTKKGN